MSKDSDGSGPVRAPQTQKEAAERRDRLAAALRDNLHRRKQQSRARTSRPGQAEAPHQSGEPPRARNEDEG
jgi:hypothetical protein